MLSSTVVRASVDANPNQPTATESSRLNLAVTSLPKGFAPDDISSVFAEVAATKGESESAAQDEGRAVHEILRNQYVFDIDTGTFLVTYDADKQQFNGQFIGVSSCTFIRDLPDCKAIQVRHVDREVRHYYASNPHGATVRVKEVFRDAYLVFVPSDTPSPIQVTLQAPVEDALQLKEHLGMLLIAARPASTREITATGIQRSKPTIHNPVSLVSSEHYLRLSVQALWLYDRKNGRVYAKIPLTTDPGQS